MPKSGLRIDKGDEHGHWKVSGPLDLAHLAGARAKIKTLGEIRNLDLSGVTRMDTAGALLLTEYAKKNKIALEHLNPEHQPLYDLVARIHEPRDKKRKFHVSPERLVVRLGQKTQALGHGTEQLIAFLGQSSIAIVKVILQRRVRFGEIVHHLEEIGIKAMPIIALIAFLIAVVLAYQSTEQLRPLGAEQFTVNLITISVLREMGVLLTAIMVAGRSGSAFTAEIGVMKVREEVDALKSIGLDVFELLVVPRLIAIVIALPLLAFLGDIMGIVGGGVLTHVLIGTTFGQYVSKVHQLAGDGHALFVGLIKAPVFAFFIGIVGCMHGLRVSGSAESVGTETTASVVQSIFCVLVIDALFSIFFQKVGL